MAEKILLVDGHSIINRAFYGVPPLSNGSGTPTNGVYGFMNILYKFIDQESPDYIAVAFDLKEPTFRHKMFEGYKGTRKPMPEELHIQVPILKDLLRASGICILEQPGYEADDIIGTMAKICNESGIDANILSGDRDLFQLLTPHTTQFIPKTKSGITTYEIYTPERLLEEYGVTPTELIDVKALQGDTSDNIPGVPGVGEKTAQSLIAQFHSISGVHEHIDEVKPTRAQNAIREHFDMAKLSYDLAKICCEAPIPAGIEDTKKNNIYTTDAYQILGRLELKSLMKRFSDKGYSHSANPVKTESQALADVNPFAASEQIKETAELPKLPSAELIKTNDISQAEEIIAEACKNDKVAVSYKNIFDEDHFILYFGEKVYDITCFFALDEDWIREAIIKLADCMQKCGGHIVTIGLAEILRKLNLPQSESYLDASIGAYLLDPLRNSYEYEDIARDYLDEVMPTATEIFSKKTQLTIDADVLDGYICHLVTVPYAAMDSIAQKLENAGMKTLFDDIEMPAAFSLRHMEQAGIRVDRKALAAYGKELAGEIESLEKKIYELAGEEFNINSPKQLGEILFDKLQLPGGKKTKSGYSTAADVLEKLVSAHEIVPAILEYRTYAKLKSTYADGLDAYIGTDERIHGHFQQTVTATGRISSTDPNLQNIPVRTELGRELRKVFIPKDGCIFVDADYSQIELRVLAHMSGDKKLIEAYNSAADIHAITASEVFHVPLADVTPEQRRNAKAVNFGIVYGISAFGLSEGLSISRKEANDYISEYFKTYPGVKEFLDRQVQDAKNKGYVTTLFGRRRPIPELKSANYMQRQFGERVAMNSPIQGTAADIMKIAMLSVEKELKKRNLNARIVLQVHDELLLETPLSEKEEVIELLKECMSGAADFAVPMEIGIETGQNWYEAK